MPWFLELTFPKDEELKEFIKQFPGTKWLPAKRCWLFPTELQGKLDAYLQMR
jgi:hypothetical protein